MSIFRSIVCSSKNLLLIAIVLSLNACSSSEPKATTAQTPTVDPRFATAESLIEYYSSIDKTSTEYLSRTIELYYAETPLQKKIQRFFLTVEPRMELRDEIKDYFGEAFDRYQWEEVLGGPMPTEIKETPPTKRWPPATITEHNGDRAKAVQKSPYSGSEKMRLVKVGTRWWFSGYTWEYDEMKNMSEEALDTLLAHNEKEIIAMKQLRARLKAGEFKTPREYYDELSRLTGEPAPHDQ